MLFFKLTVNEIEMAKKAMLKIENFSKESTEKILSDLKTTDEFNCSLPGGGFLHIESGLPYLIIYRKKNRDIGTKEIVLSEACYLVIGRKDLKGYRNLVIDVSNYFSTKYNSYLLLEIFAGNKGSNLFTIKGPADRLPKTLEVLNHCLQKINEIAPGIKIETRIEDTRDRHPKGRRKLLTIEENKRFGTLLLGLEIPPIYRNTDNELFPVFFRGFHHLTTKAIQRAIFDFIRIQTVCGVASYSALGQRYPKEKVFEIDRKLSDIENSYQFLWLVSPSNIYNIKKIFFESDFEKVLDYHYRLLPIDPDVLKRKLYGLKIEKVEDPTLSHIFRQKREELDHQITMLNERGTANFFYNSIRLHRGIGPKLHEEAENILERLTETKIHDGPNTGMGAEEFADLAKEEFDYLKEQDSGFKCKVHVRKDVNIMMVSKGELYIPIDYRVPRIEAEALIQHEVGTHVLTYFNGRQQPFSQLSIGLADFDTLQEGLAVLSEYLADGLTTNRLRTLAGRVVAGKARLNGNNFEQIFDLLFQKYGFTEVRAFNIASRIMQGGGLLKDIIYLKGFLKLRNYVKEGGKIEPLLSGKFGFHHIEIVQQLTERNILKPPVLKPRYLLKMDFEEKIKKIKQGLPLTEMVCDNAPKENLIAKR